MVPSREPVSSRGNPQNPGGVSARVRVADAVAHWIDKSRLARFASRNRHWSRLRRGIASRLLPNRTEWAQVRGGIADDLWLRLNVRTERNWRSGTHEPEVQHWLERNIHRSCVFYDIGAHLGFFALAGAKLGARVFAFEPDPENAERLRSHILANNLRERVSPIEAAVWSNGSSEISFRRGWPASQGGVTANNIEPVLARGPLIRVRRISLDEFVDCGNPPPDLIKIDVEGGEAEVLRGARQVLARYQPALQIEIHYAAALQAINTILEQLAYQCTWFVPPEGFPRQCFAARP